MLYNFNQLILELFHENPNTFFTFCHLVETVAPQSMTALRDGKIPSMSTYETKLLVCGLSRVFFGKPNSIYIPISNKRKSSQKALSRGLSEVSGAPVSSARISLNSKDNQQQ